MTSAICCRTTMRRLIAVRGFLALTLLLVVPLAVGAQRPAAAARRPAATPVKLSAVLTAFLVDSGVRTRGLPWTTGSGLPIRWETARPVRNPDSYSAKRGLTLMRTGKLLASVGDSVVLPMSITILGADSGLARVTVGFDSMEVSTPGGGGFFLTREGIEAALTNDGLVFQPLKCSRATEGASYGNLVDAMKAPGKTASGLWWSWDAPQQQLRVMLTILYRRADMSEVECYQG